MQRLSELIAITKIKLSSFALSFALHSFLLILSWFTIYSPYQKLDSKHFNYIPIELISASEELDDEKLPDKERLTHNPDVENEINKLLAEKPKESKKAEVAKSTKDEKLKTKSKDNVKNKDDLKDKSAKKKESQIKFEDKKYEREIAKWVARFKTYPPHLKSSGIGGTGIVRIRIKRDGRIIFSAIEQTTGNQELDSAAMQMISSANPLPKIPDNYHGNVFEFLIPVIFSAQ